MSHRSDSEDISFSIPSGIKYIKEASSEILEWLKPRKLDDSALFDIRLCVEEVVRNAVVHGNQNDNGLKVLVNGRIENNRLVIEVEDEGKGFDIERVPDPTTDDNIMKASGRGVYLVRKLMDEMEFIGKGNKVRIVKYLK